MPEPAAVVVTGLGMITPVGVDLIQSCSSIRAGIARFDEFEDFLCRPEEVDGGEPEPMKAARVSSIDEGPGRLAELILAALRDLAKNAGLGRDAFAAAALHLAVPRIDRSGEADGLTQVALTQVHETLARAHGGAVRLFGGGHTAFFDALEQASESVARGQANACIVGGVDSFHLMTSLNWLDETRRLRSGRNRDGFLPGEAAALLLLESRPIAEARQAEILAGLHGIAHGQESFPVGAELPPNGEGLAQAISNALRGQPIEWAACDLNGESHRSREWGLCQVKLGQAAAELGHLWHPADCIGDVGAASGAVLGSLVARAFQRGYAPRAQCVVWSASDDGKRAAALMRDS